MNISPRTQRAVLASLKKITAEVEGIKVEELEAPVPADLTAAEEFDLELDNANPMVAANEDEIESLELEDLKKDDDIPEELKADMDLVEKEQAQELDNDPVVNVADIIKGADNDGNIKFSSIKALAGCDKTVIPDDKKDDD
ncbi:MAG: hypothetical protein J6Y62_09800, partial [Clostridia bacterium]|nr:hypothetical protein [Clostridia bacterium]